MQAMCLVILCECFELSVGLPFAMKSSQARCVEDDVYAALNMLGTLQRTWIKLCQNICNCNCNSATD